MNEETITGVNGTRRTIGLSEVVHSKERDLSTNEWVIRIPDSEIRRILNTPFSRIYNVFVEWGYDEVGDE